MGDPGLLGLSKRLDPISLVALLLPGLKTLLQTFSLRPPAVGDVLFGVPGVVGLDGIDEDWG